MSVKKSKLNIPKGGETPATALNSLLWDVKLVHAKYLEIQFHLECRS